METPAPLESTRTKSLSQVKGSAFRGVVQVLRREGRLLAVAELVSPGVRELMLDLPPSSAWVNNADLEEVFVALERLDGLAACRRVSRLGILESMVPLLNSFVSGVMRLFGATPHSIASRIPQIMPLTQKGSEVTYTRLGETSLRLRFTYLYRRDVAPATFHALAGALETLFDQCKVSGVVADPVIVADERSNSADFELRWKA